ncbi:hypothetical protein K503DRAFT_843217 [Rhizopogon vinicolor AM-OR11-026]|uniref:TPR-like protein n=1 Tax=Rhizopogon vinicolor AM-OR11-026 TaxID=1314800 RepID=A0A1B7MIT0_9AGAM|nr:hypothetical protein K503DRAFT_843217 [Rhizopogon vinicolor AM-OR11-026]
MLWMNCVTTKQQTTSLINSGAFSSELVIQSKYGDFVVITSLSRERKTNIIGRAKANRERKTELFGWDLKSLWETANKKQCHALLRAGRLTEAHEAYRYMMDMSHKATTASYRDWSIGKMLWEDALLDAQKVAELNPSSYLGHQLNQEALHGARRYDEAIMAFEFMLCSYRTP